MTEEEKSIHREKKKEVTEHLQSIREEISTKYSRVTTETDQRLYTYVIENIDHPDEHNLYELLAVKRFLDMSEKWSWNIKRVKNKIRLYETLRFSGTVKRMRYKMTPIQVFQTANLFGFEKEPGKRLIRTAYVFVPRKFSKTTWAAFLAVDDMLFGDNNAEAYVGANSYDQAKRCFDEIRNIMLDLDRKQKHFKINRELVTFKSGLRESSARCLTANARTKDGLMASLAILDEYSQARDTATTGGADLKNVLSSSMGPRRSPLTVVITTASSVIDGPCYEELEGAKRVLRGEEDNDTIFASLFLPDVDDREDDPATWRKVQPHLGITIQDDYYEMEYQTAKLSANGMLTFRTKYLNIFAENEMRSWISATDAKNISIPFSLDDFKEKPHAMVSIDLSESDDFSAVTIGIYNKDEKGFYFNTDYFFPEGALKDHPNARLYRKWAEKGYLHLTDGDVIDYDRIVDHILGLSEKATILKIGYDSWKSQECVNMLATIGGSDYLKPISQTYGNFTAPVESFEHGVKTGRIHINDNPINWYCFGNAVLDIDKLENCKPLKRSHNQKIDGVITMLMCMRLFMDEER